MNISYASFVTFLFTATAYVLTCVFLPVVWHISVVGRLHLDLDDHSSRRLWGWDVSW